MSVWLRRGTWNFLYLAIQAIPGHANTEPGLPVSAFFAGMVYTSTKSLQFLSVPVYTTLEKLGIIVIAHGEVSSFGFMVLSSIVAGCAVFQAALNGVGHSGEAATAISTLNAGYMWMGLNVRCTALYVLGTRKFITSLNFKDWDLPRGGYSLLPAEAEGYFKKIRGNTQRLWECRRLGGSTTKH